MSSEIKAETLQNTQKILGKYVKKPPLTDKLLRKPPFRFLHDVINTVITETDFLNGLFTADELISENVKEKDAKLAFLNKLIDAIKIITGKNLSVRASKIIAGLEPTETNILLQTIGKAIDKKLDSSSYVAGLNDKKPPGKHKTKAKLSDKQSERSNDSQKKNTTRSKVKNEESAKAKKTDVKLDDLKIKKRTPSVDRTSKASKEDGAVKSKSKEKSKVKSSPKLKTSAQTNISAKENKPNIVVNVGGDGQKNENNINEPVSLDAGQAQITSETIAAIKTDSLITDDEQLVKKGLELGDREENYSAKIDRPKSARPKSGDSKKQSAMVKENLENNFTRENTIIQSRPKSSLRPPSVRPSSARPGAPRLRPDSSLPMKEMVTMGKINVIVENFSNKEKDDDDDNTVIIQTTSDEIIEPEPVVLDMPESKGHLVEQILEQIEDSKDLPKPKVEIDWEMNSNQRGKDVINKELEQLRSLIQSLTKTANPLGKLLNYLHEDVEAMHSELELWMNTKQQVRSEIKKQILVNDESIKPLKNTLQQLEDNIAKQEREIMNIRSTILRNEIQIKNLLS